MKTIQDVRDYLDKKQCGNTPFNAEEDQTLLTLLSDPSPEFRAEFNAHEHSVKDS